MSKTINVEYVGKYTSSIIAPLNEAAIKVNAIDFTPMDLLASAYGSCLMGTVDYQARKKGFESTVSRCEISYEMSEDGSKVKSYSIYLFFANDFDTEQENILEMAAKTKYHVGKSLSTDVEKSFRFFYKNMSKTCNSN